MRILKARAKSATAGEGIDFALGEAMAFGSILIEGSLVRLSGQVQRSVLVCGQSPNPSLS